MLKTPTHPRAVIAATVVSLGASPAFAREADTPSRRALRRGPARQWTQPRVDSLGVRPAHRRSRTPPPRRAADPGPDNTDGLDLLLSPSARPP